MEELQISELAKKFLLEKKQGVFTTIQDDISKQVAWFTSISDETDTSKSCFLSRIVRKSHATQILPGSHS